MTPEERDAQEKALATLRERKTAYQLVFSSPAGQAVLRDLMEFCRYPGPPFDPDQRRQDMLIGRAEVAARVFEYLNVPLAQLYTLKTGGRILNREEMTDDVP